MDIELMVRFCYLGNLEPTYILNRSNINIQANLNGLRRLCHSIEANDFVNMMNRLLFESDLPRRDETLLAYAIYLSADLREDSWRRIAREALPQIILNESDFFLFVKYASLVQEARGRYTCVSRTVRKACIAWYKHQTADTLTCMCVTGLSKHGFCHRILLKLCRIPDSAFSTDCLELIRKFFGPVKSIKNIGKSDKSKIPLLENSLNIDASPSTSDNASASTSTSASDKNIDNDNVSVLQNGEIAEGLPFQSLRLCYDMDLALRIINYYHINYDQIPGNLLSNEQIYSGLIEKMSIPEILCSWKFIITKYLYSFNVINAVRSAFDDNNKLIECNLHPFNYLFYDHRVQSGLPKNIHTVLKTADKPKKALHLLRQIYPRTFGLNKPLGLRMHITINVDTKHQKKRVAGLDNKLQYKDAVVGLGFGYYKVEKDCTVAYWNENGRLGRIRWEKDMTIKQAKNVVTKKMIRKSKQMLLSPVYTAFQNEELYDLFLVIIPKQRSKYVDKDLSQLKSDLQKYQSKLNPKARFIIVNVCYTDTTTIRLTTQEKDILQMCGLNENTTKLIAEYANGKF